MTRSPLRTAAVLLPILLAACAGTGPKISNAPEGSDVRIERIDREFDLDKGIVRVAIDNPWGEINVRDFDERAVGIHAVIQHMPPAFAAMKLVEKKDGGTLSIKVEFEGATKPDYAYGRADLAVYVPSALALSLATRDSRISAQRRRGPIEATSDSGEIHASSLERLSLHSASGQIRAIEIGRRWRGTSEITTDSGRIVLLVPTFGDVTLDADTGGALSTGFGLSVHARPGGGHAAHARFGSGTSKLVAHSREGEIVLEQLVLLGEDMEIPEDDD